MDYLQLALDYHRDKSVCALGKVADLMTWFFITAIAVSTPLIFSLSNGSLHDSTNQTSYYLWPDFKSKFEVFPVFIFAVAFAFLLLLTIFHLKYEEYKDKYITTIVKMVLRDDVLTAAGPVDYDAVAQKIEFITGENYYIIMNCIFSVIPPDQNSAVP